MKWNILNGVDDAINAVYSQKLAHFHFLYFWVLKISMRCMLFCLAIAVFWETPSQL